MGDDAIFQNMMAANPEDHTTRAVYADYLDDTGRHDAATKLRWWARALQHLQHTKYIPRLGDHSEPAHAVESRHLPDWVARLNQTRSVRRILSTHADPQEQQWMHEAELHALGLLPVEQFDKARADIGATRTGSPAAARRWAIRALFNVEASPPSAYSSFDYAPASAWRAVRNVSEATPATHSIEHMQQTRHLVDYAMTHEAPVKLALGGWFGRKAPAVAPVDMSGWPVRNAVQDSLRLHGAVDPAAHLDKYVAAVTRFVNDKPDDPRSKIITGLLRAGTPLAHKQLAEAVHPVVGAATKVLPFVRAAPPSPPKPSAAVATPEPQVSTQPAVTEEPLPLEEAEAPAPREHPYAAVARMMLAKEPEEAILTHLQDVHGSPNRKAAQARLRAAKNALLAKGAAHYKPTKLAKPKEGQLLNASHLKGTAYTDPYTGAGRKVHPQIAGTALAYHLRQIAQAHPELAHDADAALAWAAHSSNADADPFANLGRKLERAGSRFAKYYDWANMEQNHLHDQAVEQFARKHVVKPEDMQDHNFFDRVAKMLGRNKELQGRLKGLSVEDAVDALHRVAAKHLDRAYLAAKPAPSEYREVLGSVPVGRPRQLSRSEWISDKIAKIMHEGIKGKKVSQKQAVAVAHAMYREGRE